MTMQKQKGTAQEREDRAAVAMRENLRRRKQQQQARAKINDTPSKED